MNNIQGLIGKDSLSVSEAMQKIDKNSFGILFIVDNEGIVLGCVTDGDIRRYLLSGGLMSGPVIEAANKNPKLARSDEEVISSPKVLDPFIIK